jgi:glutamate dehydrogenase (NAD(P)+)
MGIKFEFCDELGPEKIIRVYQPTLGLHGILVVDNTAAGPSIGGCRIAPDVSVEECFRLARAMTLKNAAAGLPHGGGKSVIFGEPHMNISDKESLIRAFAQAIGDVTTYIIGPDMGTNEQAMAWCKEEIGRAVGLPAVIGGIPLDEIGATGFGLAVAAEIAQEYCDVDLQGARVAVQGFGAVGQHACRFLAHRGAVVVAASDSASTVVNTEGLDVEALMTHKQGGAGVGDFSGGKKLSGDAIVGVDCDIWIPAARPEVLNGNTVKDLKTRLVIQGANIPATADAERYMHEHGILNIPDFISNAGGVICAAVEYANGNATRAFQVIEEKIRTNTLEVLEQSRLQGTLPRQAAHAMAVQRVSSAMELRRFR